MKVRYDEVFIIEVKVVSSTVSIGLLLTDEFKDYIGEGESRLLSFKLNSLLSTILTRTEGKDRISNLLYTPIREGTEELIVNIIKDSMNEIVCQQGMSIYDYYLRYLNIC